MPGRPLLSRLVSFGRVAVAAALLAALWAGTVTAVDRATQAVDERREHDRLAIARAFAKSTDEWFAAGRRDATELGARLGDATGAAAQPAIDAYVAGRGAWGRSVIVVRRDLAVAGGSRDRLGLVGRVLPACERLDGGTAQRDNGLAELAATARSRAVVSRIFEMAPDCAPIVAAAATAGGNVVLVVADVAGLQERLSATTSLGDGTQFFLVDPSGFMLGGAAGAEPAPPHVARLLAANRSSEGVVVRDAIGRDAAMVEAIAPAGEGWFGVLETDAGVFEVDARKSPAIAVAGTLTVVFAAVFGLIAFFDIRRRRERERADVAQQAFLSIVNHELRTPLTVLKGSTDVMTAHWDRLDKDALAALVENLTPQVLRLSRVVDRLLIAANIHAGVQVKPLLAPTPLGPVVERAVAQFVPTAPLHRFGTDIAPDAATVVADAHALEQVLVQLLDNAVRFSPAGGVVAISARLRRRDVELAIDDQGVGLPADRSRLFDAFTQGEAVDRRVHAEGGVGVGLYIVRTLVSDMGGDVWAEPAASGGARLVVRLRAASVPAARGSRTSAAH